MWLRYLDEIFGIWIQSSPKLKELFNCIISLHPTIKLTMGYSTIKTNWINFLGVTVAKSGDKLGTDLYCKSTDAQQPLYEHSCHRNMYEGSIAYGQVESFKRICSIEEKLTNYFEQLKQWLVNRGYWEDCVYSKIERIKLLGRTVSLQIRDKIWW